MLLSDLSHAPTVQPCRYGTKKTIVWTFHQG